MTYSVNQKSLPICIVVLIVDVLSVLNKDHPSIISVKFLFNWTYGF